VYGHIYIAVHRYALTYTGIHSSTQVYIPVNSYKLKYKGIHSCTQVNIAVDRYIVVLSYT